jgi:hypothetical protein
MLMPCKQWSNKEISEPLNSWWLRQPCHAIWPWIPRGQLVPWSVIVEVLFPRILISQRYMRNQGFSLATVSVDVFLNKAAESCFAFSLCRSRASSAWEIGAGSSMPEEYSTQHVHYDQKSTLNWNTHHWCSTWCDWKEIEYDSDTQQETWPWQDQIGQLNLYEGAALISRKQDTVYWAFETVQAVIQLTRVRQITESMGKAWPIWVTLKQTYRPCAESTIT